MTTVQSEPLTAAIIEEMPKPTKRRRIQFIDRGRLYLVLYLLLFPTLLGLIVFNYYPKFEAIVMSLYDWDGQSTKDFIGLKNFADLFSGRDPLFWPTFQLVGILLVANAVKMWPSIFAAITLHRMKNEKWQYFYRVMFVLPMVIPGLVWLLIWKNFFDPNVGVMNKLLNATGLMQVLNWLDYAMPSVAASLQPIVNYVVKPGFGNLWSMLLIGVIVASMSLGLKGLIKAWAWWVILLLTGLFLLPGSRYAWLNSLSPSSRPAMAAMLIAVPFVVIIVAGLLAEKLAGKRGLAAMKWTGMAIIAAASLLIMLTMVWYAPTNQFVSGSPAWLSNEKLVIPSLILWGFPWIGTVGVLIYLAGLSAISQDVYEAAELDGVSSLGKMFRIELPLIMTQVRINLIFMTIGTLTDYGLILLLLGPSGGPSNVGMVPDLYMYQKAFVDARFGYACALGMVMFALILLITVIYQKYVKVDK